MWESMSSPGPDNSSIPTNRFPGPPHAKTACVFGVAREWVTITTPIQGRRCSSTAFWGQRKTLRKRFAPPLYQMNCSSCMRKLLCERCPHCWTTLPSALVDTANAPTITRNKRTHFIFTIFFFAAQTNDRFWAWLACVNDCGRARDTKPPYKVNDDVILSVYCDDRNSS